MEFDSNYNNDIKKIIDYLERNNVEIIDDINCKKLYNEILEASTNAHTINYSKIRRVTGREYRRIKPGIFFPKYLHEKAFSPNVKQYLTKCKIIDREIEIRFGLPENIIINEINLTSNIQYIITILYLCIKFSQHNCNKKLQILIILLDDNKELPKNTMSNIGPINVNSGFTTICRSENEIVVFRKEEWLKVFIHESFHAFGLEGSLIYGQNSNDIKKLYNINSSLLLGEVYVETWARILNATLLSFNKSENYNDFMEMLKFFLMAESKFSFMQASKILGFMCLDYNIVTNYDEQTSRLLYKENSNVFSYYVLTCIIISNINNFLDVCRSNNINYVRFGNSDINVKKFINFIKDIYLNENVLLGFDNEINNTSLHKGLRMSITDML